MVTLLVSDQEVYTASVEYVELLKGVSTSILAHVPSTGRMCPFLGTKKAPMPHQKQTVNDNVNPTVTLWKEKKQSVF